MPLVWCLGSIVGPMIGGALARPCVSYPDLFPRGTIFDRFPYLLPNLFSACAVLVSVVIGILFLDETHADKKHRRDPGRELGRTLVRWVQRMFHWLPLPKYKQSEERKALLARSSTTTSSATVTAEEEQHDRREHEQLPHYSTMGSQSPSMTAVAVATADPQEPLGIIEESPCDPDAPAKIFTRPVVLIIIQYGILAL